MKKIAQILFFTAGIGEILAGIVSSEILHLICKPLIMILLLIYYLAAAQHGRVPSVIAAIVFSLAGDVLLMFEAKMSSFFMVGLLSFLIAHVSYILAYRSHQTEIEITPLQGIQKMRLAFPIVLAGTGLIVVLYPVLGGLRLPVIIYALVLVVMVLNALFRYGRTNIKSFWFVFAGSVLFMVSDSLLAINKFLNPILMAEFLIMSTYIAAQYFIVQGIIVHLESKES
jgi:uncharacterized membrane protein YhhN